MPRACTVELGNAIVSLDLFSKPNAKFNANVFLGFWILFLQLEHRSILHTLFLYQPVKTTIHCMALLLAFNDVEKFLFLRISLLYVCHSPVFPHFHPKIRQLADKGRPLHLHSTSYISYTIQHKKLVLCSFNLFWTTSMNIYQIGLSDGAVSHYTLKLEIYETTSVQSVAKVS